MLSMPKNMGGKFSPLYFLAALGSGGLVVTFFMYLMFWVPHPGQPVPLFEDIWAAFNAGSTLKQSMIIFAVAGIAGFAALHFRTLFWNWTQLAKFKQTQEYVAFKNSNAETQLLAAPLALAMAVNVGFILGLVFVPNLWSYVEFLFPIAIAAFLVIGLYAFRLLGDFLGRVLSTGGFKVEANNSFAQFLPAFALSMVAVGLSAPSAMSSNPTVVAVSLALSTLFITAAVIIGVVVVILGVHAMIQHGVAPEAAPTLMVIVPFMTVVGIAILRMNHGLHVHFGVHAEKIEMFTMLAQFLSIQILFALFGLRVLRQQNYFAKFLGANGTKSAGSYALVCPGVALSVMTHFFVNKGLVGAGLIAKFGFAYWAFIAPAIILQFAMIWLVWHLGSQHFSAKVNASSAVPAE